MSAITGSTLGDMMPSTGLGVFILPDQTVSYEVAMKDEWQHKCMDFFTTQFLARRADRERMMDNYRLVNGEYPTRVGSQLFEESKMGEVPADIVHYPICNLPLKSIWGEELKRPLNYFVKAEDEDNINQHVAHSTEQLFNLCLQNIQQTFFGKLEAQGIKPDENYLKNSIEYNLSLESIDEYRKYSFTTAAEKCGNAILKKLIKSQNLIKKFRDGWKDATIVAKEFYWTGILNGEPVCECVNPVNVIYEKSYDIDFIDQSSWVLRGEYMTPQQIIDRYKSITPKEAEDLLNFNSGQYTNFADEKNGQIYTNNENLVSGNSLQYIDDRTLDSRYPLSPNERVFTMDNYSMVINGNKHYLVVHAEWMKQRKIGILTYFNEETQSWDNMFIDGDIKLSKEQKLAGWEVTNFYINEPWTGTKIGAKVYTGIKPKSDYYINPNKLSKRRLGYTGLVYNRRNARPISFLDEAKEFNVLFNIIMAQLKKDINSDLGNILFMDKRQVPTEENFDFDSWYTWVREARIAWIDSSKGSGFNQFQIAQSSLLNAIESKISLLSFLKSQIFEIMGVSPQRMGTPTQSSTATENNNAIIQSYSQTEDYFFQHNLVKERVLQNLIEDAKVAYANEDKTMTYFLDDMSISFLQVSKDFSFADLCVYVSNSGKDIKDLEFLKSLAQPALQNGTSMYDVANMVTTDSIHKIKDELKAIKKYNEQAQQAQQEIEKQKNESIMKSTQMQIEAATADREDRQAFEAEQNQLNRENAIYLAELKAIGNDAMGTDTLDTSVIMNSANLALDQSRHNYEVLNKQRDLSIKEKDLNQKRELETKKLALEEKKLKMQDKQFTREQNQQDKQNKIDKQLAEKKLSIEKIKARRTPKK